MCRFVVRFFLRLLEYVRCSGCLVRQRSYVVWVEEVKHAIGSASGVVLLLEYPLDALLELRDGGMCVLAAVIAPKALTSSFGDN